MACVVLLLAEMGRSAVAAAAESLAKQPRHALLVDHSHSPQTSPSRHRQHPAAAIPLRGRGTATKSCVARPKGPKGPKGGTACADSRSTVTSSNSAFFSKSFFTTATTSDRSNSPCRHGRRRGRNHNRGEWTATERSTAGTQLGAAVAAAPRRSWQQQRPAFVVRCDGIGWSGPRRRRVR